MRNVVSYPERAVSSAKITKQPSSPTDAIISSPRLDRAVHGQLCTEPMPNWCTLPKLWCSINVYTAKQYTTATVKHTSFIKIRLYTR